MPNQTQAKLSENDFKVSHSPFVPTLSEDDSLNSKRDSDHQKFINKLIADQKNDFIQGCDRMFRRHRSNPIKARHEMHTLFDNLKEWAQYNLENQAEFKISPDEIGYLIKSCEEYMTMLWSELPDSKKRRALEKKSLLQQEPKLFAEKIRPVVHPKAIEIETVVQTPVISVEEKSTAHVNVQPAVVSTKSEKPLTQQDRLLAELVKTEQTYCDLMALFFKEIKKIANSGFFSYSNKAKKFAKELLINITEDQIKSLTTNPFQENLSTDDISKIIESNSFNQRLAIIGYLVTQQKQIVANLGEEKLSNEIISTKNDMPSLSILSVQRGPRLEMLFDGIRKTIDVNSDSNGLHLKIQNATNFIKSWLQKVNRIITTDTELNAAFFKKAEAYFVIKNDPSKTDQERKEATTVYESDLKVYQDEVSLRKKRGKASLTVSDFTPPQSPKDLNKNLKVEISSETGSANALAFHDSQKSDRLASIDPAPKAG